MRRRRIETARLFLEELSPAAAAQVASFHRENWHFHSRWEQLRESDYFSTKLQRTILRRERKAPDVIHFWLRLREPLAGLPAGQIVGSVTLSAIVRGFFQSCFLGYKIDSRVTRRGLMRESLRAIVSYGFTNEGLHRIEANVMPDNSPSLRLIESLGFKNEGTARKYLQIQGIWKDHIHMVALRDEWEYST